MGIVFSSVANIKYRAVLTDVKKEGKTGQHDFITVISGNLQCGRIWL